MQQILKSNAWVPLLFLLCAFSLLYYPAYISLVEAWRENDAYSHGFIVPLISGYLVWCKRERLKHVPAGANLAFGIPAVAVCAMIFVLGDLSSVALLQELSLVMMTASLVLLIAGWSYLRALAFPLAYLLFMVPFLRGVTDSVYWPFQLFAAKAGTIMMETMGIPVLLEAQYIELPGVMLEVAVECSGIHYLISIAAVGIPLAYLTQRTWPRKIGLVALAVVIAILANAVRVAFIGAWAYYYNPNQVHGPFHIFQGFLVSQVGFAILLLGAWVFAKIPVKGKGSPPKDGPEDNTRGGNLGGGGGVVNNSIGTGKGWTASIVVLLAFAGYVYTHSNNPVPLKQDLGAFPVTIGEWIGSDVAPANWQLLERTADTELLRVYRKGTEEVTLYVGYYASQSQGKEMLNYSLMLLNRETTGIVVPDGEGGEIRAKARTLASGRKGHSVIFWYDLNGRKVSSVYGAKAATLIDALAREKTNGAVVVLSAPLARGTDPQKVLDSQKGFAALMTPVLAKYLP